MSKNVFEPAKWGTSGPIHVINDTNAFPAPTGMVIYRLVARGADVVLTALVGNFDSAASATAAIVDPITKDTEWVGNFSSVQRTSGGRLWCYLREG